MICRHFTSSWIFLKRKITWAVRIVMSIHEQPGWAFSLANEQQDEGWAPIRHGLQISWLHFPLYRRKKRIPYTLSLHFWFRWIFWDLFFTVLVGWWNILFCWDDLLRQQTVQSLDRVAVFVAVFFRWTWEKLRQWAMCWDRWIAIAVVGSVLMTIGPLGFFNYWGGGNIYTTYIKYTSRV